MRGFSVSSEMMITRIIRMKCVFLSLWFMSRLKQAEKRLMLFISIPTFAGFNPGQSPGSLSLKTDDLRLFLPLPGGVGKPSLGILGLDWPCMHDWGRGLGYRMRFHKDLLG